MILSQALEALSLRMEHGWVCAQKFVVKRFVSGPDFSRADRVRKEAGLSPCGSFQGLKAIFFRPLAARLKPCPDTKLAKSSLRCTPVKARSTQFGSAVLHPSSNQLARLIIMARFVATRL